MSFKILREWWCELSVWCLLVSETPVWSLRLMLLMCSCAYTVTILHAPPGTGWILTCFWVLRRVVGPDMLSVFLHLERAFRFLSRQSTQSLLGLPTADLPSCPSLYLEGLPRYTPSHSLAAVFEAPPPLGSLLLLITGMVCEPRASPLLGLDQTENFYSFL